MLRKMLVIALVALIASACSTSRIVSSRAEVKGLKAEVRSQKSEVRGLGVEGAATRTSLVVSALKWVFWIIIAIITLTLTVTITRVFRKH